MIVHGTTFFWKRYAIFYTYEKRMMKRLRSPLNRTVWFEIVFVLISETLREKIVYRYYIYFHGGCQFNRRILDLVSPPVVYPPPRNDVAGYPGATSILGGGYTQEVKQGLEYHLDGTTTKILAGRPPVGRPR